LIQKIGRHRRSTSLSIQDPLLNNQPPLTHSIQPSLTHSIQHKPIYIIRTTKRTSNEEKKGCQKIQKNPPNNNNNNNNDNNSDSIINIMDKKKNAHRRAASLSTQVIDPQKKIAIPNQNKKDENVEDLIDQKHQELISQGIISPPSHSSPLSSPQNFRRVSFDLSKISCANNCLYRSLDINSQQLKSNTSNVPSELLSTFCDVEDEIVFSFDEEDLNANKNMGRFAPNPFKMISGGFFDSENVDKKPNNPQPFDHPSLTKPFQNEFHPMEINQDYFHRERSSSLNLQHDISSKKSSAFSLFGENEF